VTTDPIGFNGGINLFNYTEDNPLNKKDTNGLSCVQDIFETIFECGTDAGNAMKEIKSYLDNIEKKCDSCRNKLFNDPSTEKCDKQGEENKSDVGDCCNYMKYMGGQALNCSQARMDHVDDIDKSNLVNKYGRECIKKAIGLVKCGVTKLF